MRVWISIILLLTGCNIFAQSIEKGKNQSAFSKSAIIQQHGFSADKRAAMEFVRKNNQPVREELENGVALEIKNLSPTGLPVYYTTNNFNAAKSLRTNSLWPGNSSGLTLTGKGMTIGLWDAGAVRSSHNEFTSRIFQIDGSDNISDHATHTGGTLSSNGINHSSRGMAYNARLESYDWTNDEFEMNVAAQSGLLISNHSYGIISGWRYNSKEKRWEWWGDETISDTEDYHFGYYNETAANWDNIAFNNPKYLIVKSAGNDRGEGPEAGSVHYVRNRFGQWVESQKTRNKDGGEKGFGTIDPGATAKNIVTIGAIEDIIEDNYSADAITAASFSAWGPTNDGRIKPDLVADGINVYSTLGNADDAYGYYSGTSMATPVAAGSLLLLQEHHFNTTGSFLKSATLKALAIHTAIDAGNAGPDYSYGWGLINIKDAAEIISNNNDNHLIQELTLEESKTFNIEFASDNQEFIKVTLCWTDPAGEVAAPTSNPNTISLVNDLDVRIEDEGGNTYYPFILDPGNPALPAGKGDNTIDNSEQIIIENPTAGNYTIIVSAKGALQSSKQDFSLVISGLKDNFSETETTMITESSGIIKALNNQDGYRNNMHRQWLIKPHNSDKPLYLLFKNLDTEKGKDVVRIYDGDNAWSTLLAEYSGSGPVPMIKTTRGIALIEFISNSSVTDKGWEIAYCNEAPEIPGNISGDIYPCIGGNQQYFVAPAAGASYKWKFPDDWQIKTTNNTAETTVGEFASLIEVTPFNGCGEGESVSLQVYPQQSIPARPDTIIASDIACQGREITLSANKTKGAHYVWSLPNNWEGRSDSSSITAKVGDKGLIGITPYNSCGTGKTRTVSLNIQSVPHIETNIAGSDNPCPNSVQYYDINKETGINYDWNFPEDWKVELIGDSVKVVVGYTSGNIQVSANNMCGEGNAVQKAIEVSKAPAKPQIFKISGTLTVTEDFFQYQWYLNDQALTGKTFKEIAPHQNGEYVVGVTNIFGCSEFSDAIAIEEKGFEIQLFPNPNNGSFNLVNTMGQSLDADILDMNGNIVKRIRELAPGQIQISTNLSNGTYLIRFRKDKGFSYKRLIVR